MQTRKYDYWYRRRKLKHVTGFLSGVEKEFLKKLAKEQDQSLARYVTRLLQRHVKEKKNPRPASSP